MKTTLFKALQAADEIHVDGHDTDGMDESDSTMEINVLDGTLRSFHDQEIDIDGFGDARVMATTKDVVVVSFYVVRELIEADLE